MEVFEIKLPGEELKLAPVGDIQYGSKNCDIDKLQRHIAYGMAHGWKFLGMGDYLDHFSPSNRRALVSARADLYDSARELLDEAIEERLDQLFLSALEESRGEWIGFIAGDHTWDFEDGNNADAVLAGMLGCKQFSPGALMLHIKVGKCPLPLKVLAMHGSGASISSTGKTLHLERLLNSFDADVVLMGHSHLKYAVPKDRHETVIKRGKPYLVRRTKILGITGSFMDGYTLGKSSYVEEKALSPIPTGGLLIEARPQREEYGWRWDMFVTS